MCLAVPMKVIQVRGDEALVTLGGLRKKVNVSLLDELALGEYVIVHAGFAIQRLDEKEAEETLSLLRQMREAL